MAGAVTPHAWTQDQTRSASMRRALHTRRLDSRPRPRAASMRVNLTEVVGRRVITPSTASQASSNAAGQSRRSVAQLSAQGSAAGTGAPNAEWRRALAWPQQNRGEPPVFLSSACGRETALPFGERDHIMACRFAFLSTAGMFDRLVRHERHRETKRDGRSQYGRHRQAEGQDEEALDVQSFDAERRLHADGIRGAHSRAVLQQKPRGSDSHYAARPSARRRRVRRLYL